MRLLLFAVSISLFACHGGTPISSDSTTKVYKSDGSRQCEESGQSPEDMSAELVNAGIDVICAQKGSDGRAYPAVCGGGTGRINVFTIHSQNQPDAEELGFAPVSDLADYQDSECESAG